jgi:hypothetical protein
MKKTIEFLIRHFLPKYHLVRKYKKRTLKIQEEGLKRDSLISER